MFEFFLGERKAGQTQKLERARLLDKIKNPSKYRPKRFTGTSQSLVADAKRRLSALMDKYRF